MDSQHTLHSMMCVCVCVCASFSTLLSAGCFKWQLLVLRSGCLTPACCCNLKFSTSFCKPIYVYFICSGSIHWCLIEKAPINQHNPKTRTSFFSISFSRFFFSFTPTVEHKRKSTLEKVVAWVVRGCCSYRSAPVGSISKKHNKSMDFDNQRMHFVMTEDDVWCCQMFNTSIFDVLRLESLI